MTHLLTGSKELAQKLGDWSWSDLAYVERIDLRATEDGIATTAHIQALFQARRNGWPDLKEKFHRVGFHFEDVSNLHLRGFGGGLTQVVGFSVRDIRENHWERIRFAVEDYEDSKIEFFCSRIRIDPTLPGAVWL